MRPFTLVELLVVIVVIAILASMLLLALKTATDTGKRIACVGNLKNIGIGLGYYAGDFNGYFPINQTGSADYQATTFKKAQKKKGKWNSSGTPLTSTTVDKILSYLYFECSGEIFLCPSDPGQNNPANGNTQSTREVHADLDFPAPLIRVGTDHHMVSNMFTLISDCLITAFTVPGFTMDSCWNKSPVTNSRN